MLLHPENETTLTKFTNVQHGDVQPNAIDLRLDSVFEIDNSIFVLDDNQKVHRNKIQLNPDKDGYFWLDPGHYEVLMKNIITVGQNEAGFVITRSTLNRNGIFLTSGLYDSGYDGFMAGVLHVNCGKAKIKKGARIGQYLNFESESKGLYDGDYGTGKEHDQIYLNFSEVKPEDVPNEN